MTESEMACAVKEAADACRTKTAYLKLVLLSSEEVADLSELLLQHT